MKKLLILILTAALLLTACGQTMPSGTAAQPSRDQRDIMGDAMREVMELVYDSITVTHGGDYVIEWEDPGMEAHIRFLLDKPGGTSSTAMYGMCSFWVFLPKASTGTISC